MLVKAKWSASRSTRRFLTSTPPSTSRTKPLLARSTRFWAPSTRSISPSSPRKELSRPPSSLVTRSTLVETSFFPWRSSFPSPSPLPVLRSPRELAVVPEVVLCAVVGVDVVVPCAVAVAAHRGDAVDPVEVASAVEAAVSRGVAAEEDLVEVVVSDDRQSLSFLVVLSYYGVLGKGSYCRNLFVSIFLCILGKICWFSVRRGCRESQPSNSCIATINYAEYHSSSTIVHWVTTPYLQYLWRSSSSVTARSG